LRISRLFLWIVWALALALPLKAEEASLPALNSGRITGTVTDTNDGTVPGATVVLNGPVGVGVTAETPRTVVANENGYFEFKNLDAGTYSVNISAEGFSSWTSPDVMVAPGRYVILTGTTLRVFEVRTSVDVVYNAEEVATEQVKEAEQQRVFGIIPNFYVVYDKDPEPLSAKLKFQLAFKASTDPVTIFGVGFLAAVNQAATAPPHYRQGWLGYGKRFGAAATDGISDIMLGGAILPSLLRQDPRYFYQGTGSNRSRTLHALSSPFVAKGDSGKWQPNYSGLGGDLASAGLSNLYYPRQDRGVGLTFQNFAITTSGRMLNTVMQEFVWHKLTKIKHKD